MKEQDEQITVKEAMQIAKVAAGTIYNKICSGELTRHGTARKALLSKHQVIEVFKVQTRFEKESA